MSFEMICEDASNLVFLGGLMGFVKGSPENASFAELLLNFENQISEVTREMGNKGYDRSSLTFVLGFNSEASVAQLNAMGEKIQLSANDQERIAFFSAMSCMIGASGVVMFDEPKLDQLFENQAEMGNPFLGIGKRGYTADGAGGLPVCEGMKWCADNGGVAVTLPDWTISSGGVIKPATAKTHMPN